MSKNHAKSLAKRGRWRSKNRANQQHCHLGTVMKVNGPSAKCRWNTPCPRTKYTLLTPQTYHRSTTNASEMRSVLIRIPQSQVWHGKCSGQASRVPTRRSTNRARPAPAPPAHPPAPPHPFYFFPFHTSIPFHSIPVFHFRS